MDPLCALLATLNAGEAALCFQDFRHDPTPRAFWALAAWIGSTAFWIVRGVFPIAFLLTGPCSPFQRP